MITFQRMFSAAHRLARDPSKCNRIHGHNYTVNAEISADTGEDGFVLPFDLVKDVIDQMDHRLILEKDDLLLEELPGWCMRAQWFYIVDYPPTTENLAQHLADVIRDAYLTFRPLAPSCYVRVVLCETPSIAAEARAHHSRV